MSRGSDESCPPASKQVLAVLYRWRGGVERREDARVLSQAGPSSWESETWEWGAGPLIYRGYWGAGGLTSIGCSHSKPQLFHLENQGIGLELWMVSSDSSSSVAPFLHSSMHLFIHPVFTGLGAYYVKGLD